MAAQAQVDLFLDSMVNAPVKDDQALMEFPFFSLQKQPRKKPLVYEDKHGVRIEVRPGDRGVATIWDKDVLIYLASLINDRIERGQPINRKIRFSMHDMLRATRRGTGKRSYQLLIDAIYRLRSTTVMTTIKSDQKVERVGFGWINDFHIVERTTQTGKTVMAAAEITLNDWMFRAIVKDRRVLTINPDYFEITQGLKRRLYELARKHCGRQQQWVISLPRLIEKCGSTVMLRQFKAELRKVIDADDLPDYHVRMNFDPRDRARMEDSGLDGRRWSSNSRIIVTFWPRAQIGTDFLADLRNNADDLSTEDADLSTEDSEQRRRKDSELRRRPSEQRRRRVGTSPTV